MVSDWQAFLFEDLTSESNVCTCKKKDAVMEDLQEALLYLQ
jgi:hypothetical protein